ncbi:hypothetical protein FKW77_005739 [Venturia effusa]|uniref:Uncharacterized protein n=1 Tax=Venturia effusa TaxID=50376 RepID=A0A517L3D1_9PEZI|nr:hypothetical protein FKW77_005739 [Venturia effusa]
MYGYFVNPSTQRSNSSSRPSSSTSRRYPLASPKVTPPTISTHSSCAIRRDSDSVGDSSNARALLSRVASSPTSPKSVLSRTSGEKRRDEAERHPAMVGAMERRYSDGYEATKSWAGHEQRDGYISFPDYEKYLQNYEEIQNRDIST